MSELADFSLIALVVSLGLLLAIASTKLGDVVPVPAPVLFLLAAAVASHVWPALRGELPILTVERIAIIALVVILLNGGIDIGLQRMRTSLGPVLCLGVLGTLLTGAIVAVAARLVIGLDWTLSSVVGAALAATDPAVMFSVLGRREIEGRTGTILEGEAGVNDPAGIALMLGVIEIATHPGNSVLVVVKDFALEMGIGVVLGLLGGRVLLALLRRVQLGSEGFYPVLVLTLAVTLYAATSLAEGSGFLAVFVAGLLLGDATTPFKSEVARFQGALASLAEIVVFVVLGLTVHLGVVSAETWLHGAILTVVIAIVARPLTVAVTLWPSRLSRNEKLFIAWSGLKGAVPILLIAFAIIGGVAGARPLYGLVFVVVLLSVLLQGTLVPLIARALAIPMQERPLLPWRVSMSLEREPDGAFDFEVAAGSIADGLVIEDLPERRDAWITMVVREGRAIRPDAGLRLKAGDRIHVLADEASQLARAFL